MQSLAPSFSLRPLLAAAIFALSFVLPSDATCVANSSPNPIAATYPSDTTGTINGTITVLPIPYALARSIIPAQYGILSSYKTLLGLPGFTEDSYPLVLETRIDYDVRSPLISPPNFSSGRLFFPFVDRLGDGHSAFRYAPTILLSTSPAAVLFSALYGEHVVLSQFSPECDAYAGDSGALSFSATPFLWSTPGISVKHVTTPGDIGPYPFSFYQAVVGQPFFANSLTCDWFEVFFDTPLSTGANAPVGVVGNATIAAPYLSKTASTTFQQVYGIKVDVAFIEHNYQICANVGGH